MKGKLFLLTMVILPTLSVASCGMKEGKKQGNKTIAREIQINPDSSAYANLGKTMTDVLFSPKKVKCYHISYKEKVDKNMDFEIQSHFVRDTLITVLDEKLTGIIQYELLSNGLNYRKDSVRVRSPYNPELEFVFEKKKTCVHVLISPSDYSWSVIYDDKLQFNWNYDDKKSIKRFCDLFLK